MFLFSRGLGEPDIMISEWPDAASFSHETRTKHTSGWRGCS
jgi:hypothetical protein